jgi:hypothetical protein
LSITCRACSSKLASFLSGASGTMGNCPAT